ncbi:aldo/keto reductase [Micromonospora sp. DT4]|uniref:aldo/keto reductase n=1 Tax=Micromonospora sp. DT4 TaxID=3393438 RepID=UPI003CEB05AE
MPTPAGAASLGGDDDAAPQLGHRLGWPLHADAARLSGQLPAPQPPQHRRWRSGHRHVCGVGCTVGDREHPGPGTRANLAIVARVREIADRAGVTPAQVALAWVITQGDRVVPIPGTKTPTYLVDNYAAGQDTLWPDAQMIVPGGPRRGRDLAVHGMTSDLQAGVRQRLRKVVSSGDVLIWEIDLISPPDNPEHCQPAALWLQVLRDRRVRQLTLFRSVPARV